ncbi:MAG: non-hydrolyzing UDP-N-acetylglucosamine 2-epimerase [Bradymonadia bacterium]
MQTPSLVHVVGARPQFIKMAVVLDAWQGEQKPVIVHTGQHYDDDMSQVFFDELGIPRPDHDLGAGGGTHAEQTSAMLIGLEKALDIYPKGVLVVYGDTNTTLAATLVAAKLKWQIVHVEAGLRSFDRTMPEEINRIAVDHLSTHLLAPTQKAMQQLTKEGLTDRAYFTGDVMLDSASRALERAWASPLAAFLTGHRSSPPEWIDGEQAETLGRGEYAVATVHRAHNTDQVPRLKAILGALGQLDWPVFLPLHPRTKNAIAIHKLQVPKRIKLLPPVGYLDFAALVSRAQHVVTDSGGVQKEALFHKRPCTTMRDTTEWPETLEGDWNRLVDTDVERLVDATRRGAPHNLSALAQFGDGHAGRAVNAVIEAALNEVE